MSDFTVTEWFESILWPTYPRDLCNRIGSKSRALTSTKQHVKDEADATTVIAGLREQMRYYRKIKQAGAHGSEWKMPMLSTWLNGEQWTNEIPSHYEHKQRIAAKLCACGETTQVGRLCLDCYYKLPNTEDWRTAKLREYYVKYNLKQQANETHAAWIKRLREKARIDFRKIG